MNLEKTAQRIKLLQSRIERIKFCIDRDTKAKREKYLAMWTEELEMRELEVQFLMKKFNLGTRKQEG